MLQNRHRESLSSATNEFELGRRETAYDHLRRREPRTLSRLTAKACQVSHVDTAMPRVILLYYPAQPSSTSDDHQAV